MIASGQYERIRIGPIQNPPSECTGTNFNVCVTLFNGAYTCVQKAISAYLPNILTLSASQTNYKVSTASDLNISVTLANDVPSNGSLTVIMPTGYPTTASYAILQRGTDLVNRTVSSCVSTDGLTVTIPLANQGFGLLASDPSFRIYVFGVTNPSTVTAVSGLTVNTKLYSGLRVNEGKTSITATLPSTITFPSSPISQSVTAVNGVFLLGLTAVLPSMYPSGGYIDVYLSKYVKISISTAQCVFGNGWSSFSSASCSLSYNSALKRIYVVGSTAYPSSLSIELSIANVKLPPEIRTLDPIMIQTYGSDGNLMSVSTGTETSMILGLTAGDVTALTLTRVSSNTINRSTRITASITFGDPFNQLAMVRLVLPVEQILVSGTVYGVGSYVCSVNTTVSDSSQNTVDCYASDSVGWCDSSTCVAGSTVSITLAGFKTPAAAYTYQRSVVASIYHYDYPSTTPLFLVDTTKTAHQFVALDPENITNFVFTITGDRLAGNETAYQTTFTTITALPSPCMIYLSFPENFTYNVNSSVLPAVSGYPTALDYYSASGSIKHLNVTSACPSAQVAGTAFTFAVSNVRNAPNTVPTVYSKINVTTEDGTYGMLDRGANTNADITISPNVVSGVSIVLTSPVVVGASASCSVSFVLANAVPKVGGSIVLRVPDEAAIVDKDGNAASCQIQVGSVVGVCQVVNSSAVMSTLSSISALGTSGIDAGTKVVISFNYLRNPQIMKTSSNFRIATYVSFSGVLYLIDKCDSCGTVTPTQENSLSGVTIVRNETVVNNPVNLTVTFTAYNPIPATGYIILHIPVQGAVVGSAGTAGVVIQSLKSPYSTLTRQVTSSSTETVIEITQYCDSSSGCAAGTTLSFAVAGMQNPSNAIATSYYFQIYTKDKSEATYYAIDAAANIVATPEVSAGQLSNVNISRGNGATLFSSVTYTIDFTISNSIASDEGQLYIQPYTETMMLSSSSAVPTCSISQGTGEYDTNVASVTCTATTNYLSAINAYEVTSLTMSLKCPSNNCAAGLTKRIIIADVLSSYRTSGQGSYVLKTILTSTAGIVDAATTSATSLAVLNPITIAVSSASRNTSVVDANTVVGIVATNGVNYESGSTIYVKLYSTEFAVSGDLSCNATVNSGTSASVACSKIEQLDAYTKLSVTDPCGVSPCPVGTVIALTIWGFANAHSVKTKDSSKYLDLLIYGKSTGVLLQQSNAASFSLLPALTAASVDGITVAFGSTKVGEVSYLDVVLTPETGLISTDSLGLSMGGQLFYSTANTACYKVSQTTETVVTCTIVNSTSDGYVSTVTFGSGLPPWTKGSQMTLRLRQVKNIASVLAYSGDLKIAASDSSGWPVASGSLSMSTLATIQPATLTDPLIKRLSIELGESTTLNVSFVLTAQIPTGGYLVVTLPLDQAVYAGSEGCTMNSVSLVCSVQNLTISAVLQVKQICPSGCVEGQAIVVLVKGFRNPSYSYADAALGLIVSYTSSGAVIHNASSIAITPSLNIPQIVFSTLSNSNPYTNQATTYYWTISLPKAVPSGGLLIFTLPANVMMISSGTPACSANSTVGQCTFTYTGQSITKFVYQNLCASGCPENSVYLLLLENIKNPGSTAPLSGNLVGMSTFSSDSKLIIDQGNFDFSTIANSIKPTAILSAGAIRGSTALGETTTLTVWFVPPDAIPVSGKVMYQIPEEYGEIQSTTKCYVAGTTTQISLSASLQSSAWTFTLGQFCDSSSGCAASANVSIVLTSFKNPTLLAGNTCTNSLTIKTLTSLQYSIDAVSSSLFVSPLLDSDTLDSPFVSILALTAGTNTTIFIQFAPSAALSQSCSLVVDAAGVTLADTICPSGVYTRVVGTTSSQKECSMTAVNGVARNFTLENVCSPETCAAGEIVTLKVPYKNLPYVSKIAGTIRMYARIGTTTDTAYGSASVNLQVAAGSISGVVLQDSLCYTTGTTCDSITLTMSLFNSIPNSTVGGGKLKLTLPSDFGYSSTTCVASVTVPVSQSLSSCSFSGTTGVATVSDSSYIVPEQSTLALTLKKLALPTSTKPTGKFQLVSSLAVGGANTIIDYNYTYYYVAPAPKPIPVSSIVFTRSAATVASTATFNLDIVLQIPLLVSGSYVILEVPNSADVEFVSGAYSSCAVTTGSTSLSCTLTSNSTHSVLTINCGSTMCGTGSSVALTIPSTVMKNRGYYNPSAGGITISTSFDSTYISQRSASAVSISPVLATIPLTVSVVRESNTVALPVELKVTISVNQTVLPSTGLVAIQLSDGAMFRTIDSLQCSVGSTILSCTVATYDSGCVQTIRVYEICPTLCPSSSVSVSLIITIDGLRNAYSGLGAQSQVQVWTASSSGYYIGSVSTSTLSGLESAEFQAVQFIESAYCATDTVANASNRLLLIYSQISLDNTYQVLLRFTSSSGSMPALLSSPAVISMLPASTSPQALTAAEANLTVTGLFPVNGTASSTGQVYAAIIKNLFSRSSQSYTLSADLSVVNSGGELIGYKQSTTFAVGTLLGKSSCSALASTCDKCVDGTCVNCGNATVKPNLQAGTCTAECADGYFQLFSHCIPCFDSNCEKCENELKGSCSICASGYYVRNGLCVAICETGLVAASPTSGTTEIGRCNRTSGCDSQCSGGCSADIGYCFGCRSELQSLLVGTGECVTGCPDGYYNATYLNVSACRRCDFDCAACNATHCTKCQTFYERFLDQAEGTCVTECPARTYANDSTRICESCNATCYRCSGPLTTNCTACTSPRYLFGLECLTSCPDGYEADSGLRACVTEKDQDANDLWPISLALLAAALAAVAVCKLLVTLRIVAVPYAMLDTLIALVTAVDTINRILVTSDGWRVKSTALFTFGCANLIVNSMATLMFHAGFFQLYLRTDGFPKVGQRAVHAVAYLSYFFGYNFHRLLTSGFFFKALSQPFRKNPEHERESLTMAKYVMGTNVAQIVIYGCSYTVGAVGTASLGVVMSVGLVAAQVVEILYGQFFYQVVASAKTS